MTTATASPPDGDTVEFTVTVRISVPAAQDAPVVAWLVDRLRGAVEAPPLRLLPPVDEHAELRVDLPSRTIRLHGNEIDCTRLEFDLLAHLARHPGKVHTRTELLAAVWGVTEPSGLRTVDVHIGRLRTLLGRGAPFIRTIRGVGYRIEPSVTCAVTS